MSKVPYVLVGIGLAGCVALAWMAQHLQQRAQGGAARAPRTAAAVAAAYEGQLLGPLATHDEREGDLLRRVFVGRAAAGEDRRALARAIAEDARRRAAAAGTACAVAVTLRDQDGANPCTVELLPAAKSPPAAPR